MTLNIGDEAPDFELRGPAGQPVRLSDYRGKKAVVLVFYPGAFMRTCTAELCGIRDSIEVFQNDNVQTLGVSVDSPVALGAWAEREGFAFPTLADFWPHGEVARAYGVFNEALGIAERGTFLIDLDGLVVYTDRGGLLEARDQEAWKQALAQIGALA